MIRFILLLFLFLFSNTIWLFSQEQLQFSETLTATISDSSLVKKIKKSFASFPDQTQIAIAVLNEDETQYIGIKKEGNTLTKVSNNTAVFEIASISKVFTATLLSHLVEKKQLNLHNTVQELLPNKVINPSAKSAEITLEMLSNHSSGLPRLPQNLIDIIDQNPTDPYVTYDREMFFEYLKNDFKTTTVPGTTYSYSNLGAGMLGELLAINSQKSYETLLNEFIFKPLQMAHSSSVLTAIPPTHLIAGLNPDGTVAQAWNFKALAGLGAIRSSVHDLSIFARQQWSNDPVYKRTHIKTFIHNDRLSIGLGWHIIQDKNRELLFHNGGSGGYTSCMILDAKAKKGVILLSNVSAFHPKARQIDGLSKTFFNKQL